MNRGDCDLESTLEVLHDTAALIPPDQIFSALTGDQKSELDPTLEVFDDSAAPIPPHQLISYGLTDDHKIQVKNNILPNAEDFGEEKEEAGICSTSQTQENPGSSNICGQEQDKIVDIPILEATLVEEEQRRDSIHIRIEPSGPVYDAVLMPEPQAPPNSCWINHKRSLLIGALLFFCISIGTIIGLALKKKENGPELTDQMIDSTPISDFEPTPEPEPLTSSPMPILEPTKSPSSVVSPTEPTVSPSSIISFDGTTAAPRKPTYFPTYSPSTTKNPTITAQGFICPGPPSAGCMNGMFSEQTCGCICISPFCPDVMGECAVAGGACADQQLSDSCTKGVDCPWWVNGLKDESCITGTVVRRDFVFLVAGVFVCSLWGDCVVWSLSCSYLAERGPCLLCFLLYDSIWQFESFYVGYFTRGASTGM
jgi:hypothetical protein